MNKLAFSLFLLFYVSLFSQTPEASSLVPDQSMLKRTLNLTPGYQLFRENFFPDNEKNFIELANKGQAPKILFIGCSDSRVAPEIILQAAPGELFVIRNAGNFVPIYDLQMPWDATASSIDFAIEALGIRDIVICGHSHCGAINQLFSKEKAPNMIENWLQFGRPAKELVVQQMGDTANLKEMQNIAGRLSVIFQLKNLLSYPFIQSRLKDGKVTLHGWYFTIENGQLEYYDPKTSNFYPIDAANNNN